MNELFTRLMAAIENLLIYPLIWLFPIKWTTIMPGSSAIRFTFGIPGVDLCPGIHFGTTGQTFQKEHVNTRLALAESMYVLTEDGVSLRIRGVTIYKITSLVKYITVTEDSDTFVSEACEAAIKQAVSLVPFEDFVKDSSSVEEAVSRRISEICKELGIQIKRYRFQDIELTDPIGRALSSVIAMGPYLTVSAINMTELIKNKTDSSHISLKDALFILSPNIQFALPINQYKTEINRENNNEPDRLPE